MTKNPSEATYLQGTVVQLSANAALSWAFDGWSGDLSGSLNPTSITMDGNKVVTATFTYSAPTPALFSDGFESGTFSSWSETMGSVSVASTTPPGANNGNYYYRGSIGTSGEASRVVKKLDSTYSALYVRMYVRMEDLFTSGMQGLGPRFSNAYNWPIGYVLVDCTENKWGYAVLNPDSTSYFETSSTMTIQPDRWYCIEFYMSIGSHGTCTLWIDGVLKLTGTYDNDAFGNIGYVSASSYCSTTMASRRTWYADDFICATTYIGPED